jgi:hypothetical protein
VLAQQMLQRALDAGSPPPGSPPTRHPTLPTRHMLTPSRGTRRRSHEKMSRVRWNLGGGSGTVTRFSEPTGSGSASWARSGSSSRVWMWLSAT